MTEEEDTYVETGGGETMDRGGLGTPSLKKKLDGAKEMEIRHARRGWLQECLCCITKSDFKYYVDGKQVAESTEEFSFCNRMLCAPHHAWDMTVTERGSNKELLESDRELLEIDRPCRFYSPLCCKCCCQQELNVSSGNDELGEIRETCYYCVPQYKIYDKDDDSVYVVHPPTCCGGVCIDFWTEGNPCTHGCCKIPFRIYDADAENTNGDAPFVGKMLKIPKDTFSSTFNETSYYKIEFPKEATTEQKGLILGSSLLINSLYFEGSE